ncbi:MAG: Gfo/Idh/MocA family oxidoreductase [Bryobacterales bacterium]
MLKGVLVGCGFFGRIQMEAWKRVEGAHIVGVCDVDPAKSAAFRREFDVAVYEDLDQMLQAVKPDFVDIATRPATHLKLARECMIRGFPVLLQKPVAETWDDARRIVGFAAGANVRMMINENWRWQRWYREIAAMLGSGRIGRPFYYSMQARARDGLGSSPFPNQPYFKDMPRLIVYETLVHHLDTARFLIGPIEEVFCRTARINPTVRGEDMALIMTKHAGGVLGMIDCNRACEPDEPGPALEIARFEGLDGKIRLRHSGEVFVGNEKVFSGVDLPGYRGDSCRATQQHFVDCLRTGEQFETEATAYVRTTYATVEACYLSARENRPVKVEEIASTL